MQTRALVYSSCGLVGRKALASLNYLINLSLFTMTALSVLHPHRHVMNRASLVAFINQIVFTGVDAIPTVTVLALTVGAGITTQIIFYMQGISSISEVASALSYIITTELGPLVTGIIIIGRSGSAITVDIGNMKINREIDAIHMLGVRIDDFIVFPRVICTTIAHLGLALYFTGLVLFSGILFSELFFDIPALAYLRAIFINSPPSYLLLFLLKGILFGLIIGSVACYHGLQVDTSRTEVPQQTQKAIINSMILIFMFDAVIAVLGR